MSVYRPKAVIVLVQPLSPRLARSGNSAAFSTAWILPFMMVSLPMVGERAWNADLPQFLLPTWSVTDLPNAGTAAWA